MGLICGFSDDLSSIDGSEDEEEGVPPPVIVSSGAPIERLLEKLQTDPDASSLSSVEKIRLSSSQKMEQSPRIFFKTSKGQIISCFKTVVHSITRQVIRFEIACENISIK